MSKGAPPPLHVRLWFDFVDPLSYVMELEVRAVQSALGAIVERIGLEIVAPPAPLGSIDDPTWAARLTDARARGAAAGATLTPPRLVPWTRKAHELYLHAHALGRSDDVRLAIYRAYFEQGQDIGRIDRLAAVAEACGLDPVAARTVLGVDRHQADVLAAREVAAAAGVRETPTLEVGSRLERGFHNRAGLLTLVRSVR